MAGLQHVLERKTREFATEPHVALPARLNKIDPVSAARRVFFLLRVPLRARNALRVATQLKLRLLCVMNVTPIVDFTLMFRAAPLAQGANKDPRFPRERAV